MKYLSGIFVVALAMLTVGGAFGQGKDRAGQKCADMTVTVVDVPACGTNVSYQGFRAPLQQAPFIKLPVGKVQPKGYDATGMTDELPHRFSPRDSRVETVRLIPMGAARLRITAFPTAR